MASTMIIDGKVGVSGRCESNSLIEAIVVVDFDHIFLFIMIVDIDKLKINSFFKHNHSQKSLIR